MKEIIHPEPGFHCGPKAILVLTKPDLVFFREYLHFTKYKHLFLSEIFYGNTGALAGPALGAPQAVILLENLIAAGIKECLVYGWAGSLNNLANLGEIFWIKEAFSAEGTSHFYLDKPSYTPCLSPNLKKIIEELKLPSASTVSIDALYRETEEFCEVYSSKVILVDMEVAALYAVAHFRGIKILAILGVSDIVYPKQKRLSQEIKKCRYRLLPVFQEFLAK